MEKKPNPFSIYDFLGYLIPGTVFLYGFLLVLRHVYAETISISSIANQLKFEKEEILVIFILLAYIAGHVLSFLSSITVERFSIWAHGYPSKYLLRVKRESYWPRGDKTRCVIRLLVGILLFPIFVLDWLLGKKCGLRNLYAKPLDSLLIDVLRNKIEDLIACHAGIRVEKTRHGEANQLDFFRYAYHYAVENAPNHLPKMQNYVALYGFLRTLTLIAVVIFWELFSHMLIGNLPLGTSLSWIFLAAILSYVLFMAFVKFYRRFSLEALMAMAVSYTKEVQTVSPVHDD